MIRYEHPYADITAAVRNRSYKLWQQIAKTSRSFRWDMLTQMMEELLAAGYLISAGHF